MEFKKITSFQSINKNVHPRMLPDEQLSDGLNTIFKDGKVKSRWGYDNLGNQLSGTVLALAEFNKLRTPDSDLIGITENSTYQYNEATGVWEEFAASYNTGTVNQPDNSFVKFNAGATAYISSAMIDETHFVLAFRDEGDSNKGKCIVGTRGTNGLITFGSEVEFNAGATTYTDISCLGINGSYAYIVVVYTDAGNSNYGTCRFGTIHIATGVISFSSYSEYAFNAYATTYPKIKVIDFNFSGDLARFCIAYAANSVGSAIVVSVPLSTGVISYGTVYNFNSSVTGEVSLDILDSTHVIIAYESGSPIYCYIRMGVITLSSKIIDFTSYSPNAIYGSAIHTYPRLVVLNSTNLLISYYITGATLKTYIKLGVINTSDGSISFFTHQEITGSSDTHRALAKIDSTRFIFAYASASTPVGGTYKLGTVNLSTGEITLGSGTVFEATVSTYLSIIVLNTSGFVITLRDYDDSNHGTIKHFDRLGFSGSGTSWVTTWPDAVYDIKFGTNSLTGVGTPNIWYKIHKPESATYLVLSDDTLLDYLGNTLKLLSSATNYVIRISFQSTANDFFDTCNIIKEIGTDDEKQIIFTNGVDPIKRFDGTTLDTLPMNGDGGTPPISLAKFCAYYNGILIFAYCYDTVWMPQTLYWSRRGYPTHWDSSLGQGAGYMDLVQGDDYITKMEVLNQRLYILKQRSIVECYATGMIDPALEFTEDKVKGIGCPYGRTCVNTGTMLIFKSETNIIGFNGFQPNFIGDDIIQHIKDNENPDYKHKAFSIGLRKEFLYCLFIVKNGSTSPNFIYVLNWMTGSWTLWQFAHNMSCAGEYLNDKVVFGDINGNVYLMDFTELTDNGIIIPVNFTTKDFFDSEYALKILQTMLTTESNTGSLQIRCSVDYGNTWSAPITINQNTITSIYEHVQNWLQRGEQVRYKINNVTGSQFAIESFTMKYKPSGKSLGR